MEVIIKGVQQHSVRAALEADVGSVLFFFLVLTGHRVSCRIPPAIFKALLVVQNTPDDVLNSR